MLPMAFGCGLGSGLRTVIGIGSMGGILLTLTFLCISSPL